jgi:hypothetical protein
MYKKPLRDDFEGPAWMSVQSTPSGHSNTTLAGYEKETHESSLKSLSCRLGTRAASNTPLITAAHFQPLFRRQLQFALQLRTGFLAMDEVAEATTHASLAAVESTARLSKIGHGR